MRLFIIFLYISNKIETSNYSTLYKLEKLIRINMKKGILSFVILFITNYSAAQLCSQDSRFTNTNFFLESQIEALKGITYGNAIDYLGNSQELKMDLYYPNNKIDPMTKRPFILLIHGGGFTHGNRQRMTYHCKELAKRGFVVATMSYRLGYKLEGIWSAQKAVYRAQQDAHTALHFIASQSERFKIDPSWLFIGGSSAGAITSLCISYASQAEWNQINPDFESVLGPLVATDNSQNQLYTIKGIYNFMGAISPIVFESGELIPTISFHGELDTTVPIGKSLKIGFGSRPIHELLSKAGVCNDLTVVPDGGHGIYRSQKDVDFRINRVACFFKSLICNSCVDFVALESIPATCIK